MLKEVIRIGGCSRVAACCCQGEVIGGAERSIEPGPGQSYLDARQVWFKTVGILHPVTVSIDIDAVAQRSGTSIAEILEAVVGGGCI